MNTNNIIIIIIWSRYLSIHSTPPHPHYPTPPYSTLLHPTLTPSPHSSLHHSSLYHNIPQNAIFLTPIQYIFNKHPDINYNLFTDEIELHSNIDSSNQL